MSLRVPADRPVRLSTPTVALWRSEGVLQLGLDPERALVVHDVPEAVADVARALAAPHTPAALETLFPGLSPDWIRWLIRHLDAAGLLVDVPAGSPPPVAVVGSGALADAVAAALADSGLDTVSRRRTSERAALPELVVVASATTEPDRSLTEELFRSDRVHLVVRIEPDAAVVGPLVIPGRTPCVRCLDLLRGRLDPAWPRLLAQLCRQPAHSSPTLLAWAAVTATTQVRGWLAGTIPESAGRSLELSLRDYRMRSRSWPGHPACGCLLAVA